MIPQEDSKPGRTRREGNITYYPNPIRNPTAPDRTVGNPNSKLDKRSSGGSKPRAR